MLTVIARINVIPPDRLFELDNSVTQIMPIPNDTFSDSPKRHPSNATILDADIALDVEISSSKRRSGGERLLVFVRGNSHWRVVDTKTVV